MLDLISMWRNPKMIGFMLLTALLYVGSLYPFQALTAYSGYADFGRIGIGIPVGFSFLFGPAAAWGAAIGNVLRDIAQSKLDAASFFGFIGNFFIGYIPYKLWQAFTSEKPDLKSAKKIVLFAGVVTCACVLFGLTIGWGLDWLNFTPFMPTAAIIALPNVLFAGVTGAIVLLLTYGFVSRRKLLYTDLLNIKISKPQWSRTRSLAMLIFVVSAVACFLIGMLLNVDTFVLLPFVGICIVASAIACR
jgi:energy-coupling factor transport system substrate-specific component